MEVNELRSGNWIDTKDFHIDEFKGLYQYDPEWYKYVHMFEPIPLTEEWLIKFGFEKKENKWYKLIRFPTVRFLNNKLNVYVIIHSSSVVIAILDYVHQLQNLYFALTGEELTLK